MSLGEERNRLVVPLNSALVVPIPNNSLENRLGDTLYTSVLSQHNTDTDNEDDRGKQNAQANTAAAVATTIVVSLSLSFSHCLKEEL